MQIRETFQQIYTAETEEEFEARLKKWYFWATQLRRGSKPIAFGHGGSAAQRPERPRLVLKPSGTEARRKAGSRMLCLCSKHIYKLHL